MEFRIADTFTASLARLTGDEQKRAKTTAFDLQVNAAGKGLSFHKLDKAQDPHFCSVRVSRDLRLIIHKTDSSLLLCYVDHHDNAYRWAQRRKLLAHPTTGAAQLVELRERVEELPAAPAPGFPPSAPEVPPTPAPPPLFAPYSEAQLLAYGVPPDWLRDVQALTNEDALLTLAEHLPSEAAEALLELATGGQPVVPEVALVGADPFLHPDAQRRFRIMADREALEQALEAPWEKWTVFLHPAQRHLVERNYKGPARVFGSAGTGKTVVALHRAVHLARSNENARVLLTTFSEPLANVLRGQLHRLIWNSPSLGEQIEVHAMETIGRRLYRAHCAPHGGKPIFASREAIAALLESASQRVDGLKARPAFLLSEWEDVVDAWQVETWEAYRDAKRLGRKTRLPEAQRALYWQVFAAVRAQLKQAGEITQAQLFASLAEALPRCGHAVFDAVVVDESQDISVQQLRFVAALTRSSAHALFFAGDLGQRIFQTPFSWKALGVDVRGRSHRLKINYRTSHQIRAQADRLLDPEVCDVDGNVESRKGTISVFNGPQPLVCTYPDAKAESEAVAAWLRDCCARGVLPHEIGVFVRSESELPRAQAAVAAAGLRGRVLGRDMATAEGCVSITTMHLAKGMEFRAVAVMACDDDVLPSQARIETATEESDLNEIYHTERHLLYVACTRAREWLHVSAVSPGSEFLQDLLPTPT